jgi:hypothetical protein
MEQLKVGTSDLSFGGKEEGCCGCSFGVVHRGIPHDGACPPAGGAHGGSGQYPWPEGGGEVLKLWPGWVAGGGGGQYPVGGDSGGYIEGCLTMGDPPHSITGVGPI